MSDEGKEGQMSDPSDVARRRDDAWNATGVKYDRS
jgi:hypothetical protein